MESGHSPSDRVIQIAVGAIDVVYALTAHGRLLCYWRKWNQKTSTLDWTSIEIQDVSQASTHRL